MDLAALDIKIGADLSELQKDLDKAGGIVDNFSKNLAAIGSSGAAAAGGMSQIAKSANQISEAFAQAPLAVNKLNTSLSNLSTAGASFTTITAAASKLPPVLNQSTDDAKKLQSQFAAFGKLAPFKNVGSDLSKFSLSTKNIPQQLQGTAKASNSAAIALSNLGRVAQDAPFGFIGIQNNINPLLESFQRLKAETGSTGKALKALAGSLTGAGGLGLAISLASSAFLIYSQYAQKAKKESHDFLDTIAQTSAEVNTELTSLSALISVARNYGESTQTRTNAIKELQKEYPGYLANINLENINSQETQKAIDGLTAALVRKSQVQAYSNLLTKAQESLIKAQNSDLSENVSLLDQGLALLKSGGANANSFADIGTKAAENQNEAIKKLQDTVDNYSHKLAELKEQQAEGNEFELLSPTKAAKTKRDIESINDVLEKLRLDLSALSVRELNEGLNLSNEKINKIEDVITKLITNFKVDPNDTIIQKLFGDINAIKFSLPNFKTFIQEFEKGIQQETPPKIPIEIKPVYDKAAFDDAVKRAQVDIAAKSLKLGIDTSAFSGNEVGILSDQLQDLNYINYALMRDFGVGLPASVAKALAAFRQAVVQANALYEANVALNDFVNNYAIASFEALGDAIGTALAGGEFENLFSTLFKTLAEGLKVLGDTMIKAGVEIIAIKLALNSLNPVLAIAAGIALRALGSFVESKAPHLAGGGIIPPGYDGDRFPAMLNSGEAVIPLDKLKEYINPSGEPIVFIPQTRLSGNDIVIAYERTTRKNKRTY